MRLYLCVLFFFMCSLFVSGCTSSKNTGLLERDISRFGDATDRKQIEFKKNGGGATNEESFSSKSENHDINNRGGGAESIHAVFTRNVVCYNNVNDKSDSASLSDLIWTKKQFNSSDVKGKSAIQFSTTSENVLDIKFIVDGYAIRQEALLSGVDFDVQNDSIILKNAFGAAVNNGARPNHVSLRPDDDKIIAIVNSSGKYEFKKDKLACNLKDR